MKPHQKTKDPKRTRRPRCPACRVGGYTQSKALDGRPRFHCGNCGLNWTSGKSGHPYAGHAQPSAEAPHG
jgi:transposase-like protein